MDRYSEQETRKVSYTGYSLTDLKVGMPPTIEVVIPSLSPGALGGPVAAGTETNVLSFFDPSGAKQQTTVTTSNTVTAEWYGKTNSDYAPLIKKKEQVRVFQIGNGDKFYWEELGRDSRLRTLDRERKSWKATPVVGQETTDSNSWSMEVNPAEGFVRFKTSKANGEPYAYVINLDVKKGTLTVTDDKDNFNKIYLDSANDIIHLSNSIGAAVHLEKKNANIEVPSTLTVKTGEMLYFDSPVIECNHGTSNIAANRHTAAVEDLEKAAEATAKAIKEVAKAAKTSVDTSGITSNTSAAKINNLKGV